ncbi:methyl-accepting chemotaxis protein [Flexibacterium corallicola]|uniref:methyl-accepting chemotaxis protein n=1 Tax=Flexibacterium corallicola TaxID=3037259 RepID=UPI00286F3FE8|nr:methyl-accepting chemotaxis protein [Pseudovibrio sp. M1P-2-3]
MKLGNWRRLRVILPVSIVGLALIGSITLSFMVLNKARDSLFREINLQLEIVADGRHSHLADAQDRARKELITMAVSSNIKLLSSDLLLALDLMDGNLKAITEYFQKPGLSLDQRAALEGDSSSIYGSKHKSIHGDFYRSWNNASYSDIYVLDETGRVVYSVTKSAEFLNSVKDGVLANTALADVYKKAENAKQGEIVATQFAPYALADGENSLFAAAPIYLESFGSSEFKGALVFRFGSDFLDPIMTALSPIGKSNQSYLINAQGKLLSSLPLRPEFEINQVIFPEVSQFSLSNQSVDTAFFREKSFKVMGADFFGQMVAVISEKEMADTLATVNSLRDAALWVTLPFLLVVFVVGLVIARFISVPMQRLSQAIARISGGNLKEEIPYTSRKDEIGDIAAAVKTFQVALINEAKLQEQQVAERERQDLRSKRVSELNQGFDEGVRHVLHAVDDAYQTLRRNAESMARISEQTNSEAQTVSSASEQSLVNLQAVAGATEELTATVGEIEREVRHSADISQEASQMALSAETTVHGLQEAASRIGEVVSLINDIAEQTNLLALNATIEAARAGEAGKGFAVVASEVKELANQTGRATGEISSQIQAVQQETQNAVAAIQQVAKVIKKINEVSVTVAGAVEEQTVTTTDISSSIQQVAAGSSEVATSIGRVSEIAGDAGQEADSVLAASDQLSAQAEALSQLVETYLENLRAA